MRKLGNTPRLFHLLTVLVWTFNKLAASLTVSKVSVPSTLPSEILFIGYSAGSPSISGYPFFVDKILSLDTTHDLSYRTVNLTSQELIKHNSYVTYAYNRQMKAKSHVNEEPAMISLPLVPIFFAFSVISFCARSL